MTINSNIRKAGPFIGNGTASTFPFTFKVFQASDLQIVRLTVSTGAQTTLVLNSDYTVTLNQEQNSNPGGSITLIAGALASGYNLIITSDIGNLQPTDLTNQGGFYPDVINDALDRATIQIQQLQEKTDRTIKYPVTDPVTGTEIPAVAQRAGNVMAFDVDGSPIAGPSINEVNTITQNLANITTVANDLNEPVSEINTVAVNINNVNTVGNNIADVNTVAANIVDVNNVADNIYGINNVSDAIDNGQLIHDVYQGAHASDPTVRLDGSPLQEGDLYFNTSSDEMRVYTGSYWTDFSPTSTGNVTGLARFSGNNSTTAFSLGVVPVNEDATQVYINGIYQQKDTYTVVGSTLTFDAAPPSGTNNIEVVILDATSDVQNFSGNGVTTNFSLGTAPGGKNNTQVYISGVYQQKGSYAIFGSTLSFDEAPPSGSNNIEVVIVA